MNDFIRDKQSDDRGQRLPDIALSRLDQKTEAALAALRPSALALDVAAASFEAGRRAAANAARRQLTRWRVAAGVAIAAGVAAFLARGGPTVVERVELVERERIVERRDEFPPLPLAVEPDGPGPVAVMPGESVFSLQQVALERGVDALPRSPGSRAPALNLRALP